MPVKITKHGSKWSVKTPHGVKAKATTKKKAEAQARLLRAVDHGWKPTGKSVKARHEHVERFIDRLLTK